MLERHLHMVENKREQESLLPIARTVSLKSCTATLTTNFRGLNV